MALRLAGLLEWGELFNTRRNSVHGCLQLRGMETPIMVELTGNCDPDLAGWHIQFEPRPQDPSDPRGPIDPDETPPDVNKIALHQIGAVGTMTAAHRVRLFDCSLEEFLTRSKLGDQPRTYWVRCLYLEWYSQNGRVLIELPDPVLEFVERVELPGVPMCEGPTDDELYGPYVPPDEDENPAPTGLSITRFEVNDEGDVEVHHEVYGPDDDPAAHPCGGGADDPFGLVPSDFQRHLDSQAAATDRAAGVEDDSDVIRECELMDDLMESDADIPLCSIFDKKMRLPSPDDLDEKKAEGVMLSLLAQLALFGIAFHVCEHYTWREAYRLLVEKVLWEGRAYPQLRGTGWVTNMMTSEYCEKCDAEMERKYEEGEKRRSEAGEKLPGEDDAPIDEPPSEFR